MARRLTCLALITAIWCTFAGASFAQDNYQFSDPNVQDIFRYARMAVGGGVSKVKALEYGIHRMPARLAYPGSPQEETMTFDDRRDVGGLKLPFHITTTAGSRVIDALILEQILVNPEIAKGDFKR
jgi:hypothetical protein